MSVQFAQKNELERIANLKGDDMLTENNLRSRKKCHEELDSNRDERTGVKYEAAKSLSMEISEECSATASIDGQFHPNVKSAVMPGLRELDSGSPTESSSSDKELMQKTSQVSAVR